MNIKALIFAGASVLLCASGLASADAKPTFGITLPFGVSSTINLDRTSTATIKYTVINNTRIERELTMGSLTGVTQIPGLGKCNFPSRLSPGQSCDLELFINGAQIPSTGIAGGPRVCKTKGNGNNNPDPNLCSVPERAVALNVISASSDRTVTESVDWVNSLVVEMLFPFKPTLPPGGLPWRVKVFVSSLWGLLTNGFNIPASVNVYSNTCGSGVAGTSLCVIAGNMPRTDNPSNRRPVLLQSTDGGLTWVTVNIPALSSAVGRFSAVSCGTDPNGVSTCIAIGVDTISHIPFLAQTTDSGATWAVVNTLGFTSSVTLNGVDCSASGGNSLCQATGNDGYGPVVYYSFTQSLGWFVQPIAGSNILPSSVTNGISCVSTGGDINCLVALNNNGDNNPALIRTQLIGGINYLATNVANANVQGVNLVINGVGCALNPANKPFCAAAGVIGNMPFVAFNNDINLDGGWSSVNMSLNATQGQFVGVSCATLVGQVFCNAAGSITRPSMTSTMPFLYTTRDSGASWVDTPYSITQVLGSFTSSSATVSDGKPLFFVTGIDGNSNPVIVQLSSLNEGWATSQTFVSLFEIVQ